MLTGLFNRHHLEGVVARLSTARIMADDAVVLCLIDIDHFKSINDRYGHATGDEVLGDVAASIREAVRLNDCAIRHGGEEFLIVLRGSSMELALWFAGALRARIAGRAIVAGGISLMVTASFGLAVWDGDEPFETAFRRADRALYGAKSAGRNRVEAARWGSSRQDTAKIVA